MLTVETIISFEAAHRLYGVDTYSTACKTSVHGHSYKVKIVVGRGSMNDAGMVVDFKLFKKVVKEAIEDKYDHSLILRDIDPLVLAFKELAPEQNLHVVSESPTAEWMAEEFAREIAAALHQVDSWLDVISVSVQETENNIATWTKVEPKGWN